MNSLERAEKFLRPVSHTIETGRVVSNNFENISFNGSIGTYYHSRKKYNQPLKLNSIESIEILQKKKNQEFINDMVADNMGLIYKASKKAEFIIKAIYPGERVAFSDILSVAITCFIENLDRVSIIALKDFSVATYLMGNTYRMTVAEFERRFTLSSIRLPAPLRYSIQQYFKYCQANDIDPRDNDIDDHERFGRYSKQSIIMALNITSTKSLDEPMYDDDSENTTLGDCVGEEIEDKTFDSRLDVLLALSCSLTPKEFQFVDEYFGLSSGHHLTLDDVGRKHNITRERVRQVLKRSIIKIQSNCQTLQNHKKARTLKKVKSSNDVSYLDDAMNRIKMKRSK